MIRVSKKLTLAAGVTAIVLGLGTGIAFAAAENDTDGITPASTNFTSSSTNITFKGTIDNIPITVTCSNSSISGTTPAAGGGLGPFNINNPTFGNCGSGLTVKTNNTNGHWQLTFVDAANDEGSTEGSGQTGDQIKLTIPKAGATFTDIFLPGCTITVAPTGSASVTGTYDDVNTLTLSNASVPVSASGCTSSSTTSATGTFSSGTTHIQDSS